MIIEQAAYSRGCIGCVAMRERNPEKPQIGKKTEQRLEMKKDGLVNTITTVQKDNLILEAESDGYIEIKNATENESERQKSICAKFMQDGSIRFYRNDKRKSSVSELQCQSAEGVAHTITTLGDAKVIEKNDSVIRYRIRKLTPRECWRLMGYTDEDFDKASAVNSNTQLYKQAGNAIVKQVLMAIFSQLNIKSVPTWNERNKTA